MASGHIRLEATDWHVTRIAAFTDNYIWLLVHRPGTTAAVIDPGDAAPVLAELARQSLTLTDILITHHHNDHVGGIAALVAATGARVHGPAHPAIAADHRVNDGDTLPLPALQLSLQVWAVPGHTLSHVAYVWPDVGVFCGDTLFAGGCGRLFEGTPAQMWQSLQRLAGLPADSLVWCAHEYTESNLRFAAAVDTDNPALQARIRQVAGLRAQGEATVPSRIDKERATNPFLRAHHPALRRAAEARIGHPLHDDVAVFTVLREWKNNFR